VVAVSEVCVQVCENAAPGREWSLFDGPAADRFAEEALLGRTLRGPSGLELDIGLPTPRCVVPTRAQEGLPADPRILRTLVKQHRVDLGPFGRQGCAGAYAEVTRTGRVGVGERLDVQVSQTTPEEAITTAVARLVDQIGGA